MIALANALTETILFFFRVISDTIEEDSISPFLLI